MKTSVQEKRLEKLDLRKEKSFDINKNFDNFNKKRRRCRFRSRDKEKKKDISRSRYNSKKKKYEQ